jgi:hypothetical protein
MRLLTTLVIAFVGMTQVYAQPAVNSRTQFQNVPSNTTLSRRLHFNDSPLTLTTGYLGLVRTGAPNDTILRWSADTAQCPAQIQSIWFHMKNFGTESIQLCSPVEPESPQFSVVTDCNCFNEIGPGVTTPCSLQVSFNASSDGLFRDTMYIETDARNSWGGYVRIPLSGVRMSTPDAPNVVLTIENVDAHLYWNRVSTSIGGCNLTVSGYNVYYSPSENGPYQLLGMTGDTTFLHTAAILAPGGLFYHVIAQTSTTLDLVNPPGDGDIGDAKASR